MRRWWLALTTEGRIVWFRACQAARHTCATLLLCRNVHPKYVQELLGRVSIAQIRDPCSHVLPGMDGGIGDAIDDALG